MKESWLIHWFGVLMISSGVVVTACSAPQAPESTAAAKSPIAQPTPSLYASDVLASKVSVGDFTGSLLELVEFIRWHHGTMISFVEAQDDLPVHVYLNNASVQELLESVVGLSPKYRYETILNRLVLYPRARMYQRVVTGIHVEGLGRGEARDKYIKILRSRDPDFDDLGRMDFTLHVGIDGPDPVMTEPVSLTPRARVIEHFVQLLGDDRGLVLTITYAGVPGESNSKVKYRQLLFDEVRIRR